MKALPSLGEQEMLILKYITDAGPLAVREVALHFEKERGLARTTVLTVMERLRAKGLLSRQKKDGIFQYVARLETQEIVRDKVSQFIEKTLGGSVTPLFNYLFSSDHLSAEDVKKLREIAQEIAKREGGVDDRS